MNADQFTVLAQKCQDGDNKAMEQLLLKACGPVFYLARKISQSEDSALHITREVLGTIYRKLDSLADPAKFVTWMCRIAAARCMYASAAFHQEDQEPRSVQPWLETLTDGEALTEERSAEVIQQMVDALPHNQRLCILLLGCGGLSVTAIAQLTCFSEATVKQCVLKGQAAIQQHLWELDARGIRFTGLTSLTGILRTAMLNAPARKDAVQIVYPILGKKVRAPFSFSRLVVRFLTSILFLELAGIGLVGGYLAWQMLL